MRVRLLIPSLLLVLGVFGVPSSPAFGQSDAWPDPRAGHVVPYATAGLSHGPLLGRVTKSSVVIWARTRAAAQVDVLYGTRLPLGKGSAVQEAQATNDRDQTVTIKIDGLKPDTRYFYAIRVKPSGLDEPDAPVTGQIADLRERISDPWPSFKTLPDETACYDKANNPRSLFNVKFAVGHCASQAPDVSGGQYTSTPAYDMIREHHADEAMFAIVNGDVIYEEMRDGTLDGVRDNYKLYFSRGRSFGQLFRRVPALFTFDDHDVGWDIHGCGQIGLGEGRHLIRDTGLRAYEEYLGWANYRGSQSGRIRHGKAILKAGSDVLLDEAGGFANLDPATVSTIHLGAFTRGEKLTRRRANPPKNAGVYGLVKVLDDNRLRITPATRSDAIVDYTIGTHHYYDWRVSNCHFFALDTRGERSSRNPKDRNDKSLFILGSAQEKWLLDGVRNTDADFIFVISPDPWTIYHTAAHVGGDDKDDKGDGFPSFLHQRERLLAAMDAVQKPILIFTGDVHSAASVRITNNIYELMCGPLGSTGHPLATLGNPPTGGRWQSMGRDVEMRWVSGFPNNLPYQKIRNTYYGVVQVNNVLKTASPLGGYQYAAYDQPQVVVRWHNGYTGQLVYAESVTTGDAIDR